jgi:hypothetical protein
MKKLIYFPFALFIILMAVSCKKDDSVKPISPPPSSDSMATVSLVNNSGTAYEVAFDGMTKYTVDMHANGRQAIQVKAGTYNVQVYPTGTYASHTIAWSGLAPVISARAFFSNVLIKPADQQNLLIY